MSKKKHHFLPIAYQRAFMEGERLHVYDISREMFRFQRPEEIGNEGYYYAFTTIDGGRDNETIENFFSETIEAGWPELVQKIENQALLTSTDKEMIATFVSFQRLRVPEFKETHDELVDKSFREINRRMIPDEDTAAQLLADYADKNDEILNIEPKEVLELIQSDRYRVKAPKESYLKMMMELAIHQIEIFLMMDWVFIHTDKDRQFITSDNPFYILPPKNRAVHLLFQGVGLVTPGAKKVFVISPTVLLVMLDRGEGIQHVTQRERKSIRGINHDIAISANRLLISGVEPLLKRVVKVADLKNRIKNPRVVVG